MLFEIEEQISELEDRKSTTFCKTNLYLWKLYTELMRFLFYDLLFCHHSFCLRLIILPGCWSSWDNWIYDDFRHKLVFSSSFLCLCLKSETKNRDKSSSNGFSKGISKLLLKFVCEYHSYQLQSWLFVFWCSLTFDWLGTKRSYPKIAFLETNFVLTEVVSNSWSIVLFWSIYTSGGCCN